MNAPLRFAILLATSLGGFAVAPTQGADGTLPTASAPVAVGAADHWRLRPTVSAPAPVIERSPRAALPVPEARRSVRLVYPALVEAR